jgi:hypothetical protein
MDRAVFRPRSRVNAAFFLVAGIFYVGLVILFRKMIPQLDGPMGTAAHALWMGACGVFALPGLVALGQMVLELFRHWELILDTVEETVTVAVRTPFGKSKVSHAFSDIQAILLGRRDYFAGWLVQLSIRSHNNIELGFGPWPAARRLADRFSVITGAKVFELGSPPTVFERREPRTNEIAGEGRIGGGIGDG